MWGEAQETSFQCLGEALTKAPVLMQPDLNSTFYLETDASDVALGCVLSQKRDGVMHPCAYLSRDLTSAERNYPILEREALAKRKDYRSGDTICRGAQNQLWCKQIIKIC